VSYIEKNLEQKRRNYSEMRVRHSWEYWKDVTRMLERSRKLDALDGSLQAMTTKEELYNSLLGLANTVEELVVLSFYAGHTVGYMEGLREAESEWSMRAGA